LAPPLKTLLRETIEKLRNAPQALQGLVSDYQESYRRGVERFGVWWTVFQLSIWCMVLIFVFLAVTLVVFFLPRLEAIYWELR